MSAHEPEIAIVASPRGWAGALHRHVADHGGARVRATVLDPYDAVAERYDVLVVDNSTSFLGSRLVTEVHRLGRRVLGVYDPEEDGGSESLRQAGVDEVIASVAGPEEFLAAIARLHPGASAGTAPGTPAAPALTEPWPLGDPQPRPRIPSAARSAITFVGGPPGGAGVTEVAIAIADLVARRGQRCVLLDGDDRAPALVPRLALSPYPTVLAAIDAVEQGRPLGEADVHVLAGGLLQVLPGTAHPGSWGELRPSEVHALLDGLTAANDHVVVDGGERPWGAPGGSAQAAGRVLLERAGVVVAVGTPTPLGITRLASWLEAATTAAPEAALHLVMNRAASSPSRRAEIKAELTEVFDPDGIVFTPHDPRVEEAAWAGGLVAGGPFVRAARRLVDYALPAPGGAHADVAAEGPR